MGVWRTATWWERIASQVISWLRVLAWRERLWTGCRRVTRGTLTGPILVRICAWRSCPLGVLLEADLTTLNHLTHVDAI